MALNHRFVPHSPEDVYRVLSEPELYDRWVVGAAHSQRLDDAWPEPGSTLRHEQGAGPLRITDVTTVRSADPPTSMVLDAHVRPFLTARVTLTLRAVDGGTVVWMREELVDGPLRHASRLADIVLVRRNAKTLERLERLAAESARQT
jgi:uncharacterized protein YndB with AHSA1/START domain